MPSLKNRISGRQGQLRSGARDRDWRTFWLLVFFTAFAAMIGLRLFMLQAMDYGFYSALAKGQHDIFQKLFPARGKIFVQDLKDGSLVAVATNRKLAFVYADPRAVEDPAKTAEALGLVLGWEAEKILGVGKRLENKADPFEPIQRGVSDEVLEKIIGLDLKGILYVREEVRFYPEPNLGGQFIGFLGSNDDGTHSGKYGIEGYFEKELAGTSGFLRSSKDIAGRLIVSSNLALEEAKNGDDILLTIDRAIQYKACESLRETVKAHEADSGSVIIMDPQNGKILAMCGAPDFRPDEYGKVDSVSVYNNPVIFDAYESGSVFKAVTMAAAIDTGAVEPNTTYDDKGEVKIDVYTIRNSDKKAHGIQTMTEVLEKSLNTGTIFAMRRMGVDSFLRYVKAFGFGERFGVELETEVGGDIRPLETGEDVYAATSSYGQGITVTPLQLAAAYSAIANGGILYRPTIVAEIRHPDGTSEIREPQAIRRVIEPRTSQLLSAMLVSVAEQRVGLKARLGGYYVAGKTGTAQVPKKGGKGYEEDATIATMAGFAPVSDPKFVIIARIDHPRDTPWAEATAGPLFAELADFLLEYLEIPPSR